MSPAINFLGYNLSTWPITIACCFVYGPASAVDYKCAEVGADWVWFSDHAAVSLEYLAVGAPSRVYEIGTGISVAGSPRGLRKKYTGSADFSAWGIGAVHIRQADVGPPFKICLAEGKITPVMLLKREF